MVVFLVLIVSLFVSHYVFSDLMEVTLKQREQSTCQIYAWYSLQISPWGTFMLLTCPWYVRFFPTMLSIPACIFVAMTCIFFRS